MDTKLFTQEEYLKLQEIVIPIRDFIPGNHLDFIWDAHKRIQGRYEPTPCKTGCGGAAAHWERAVITIREYLKGHEIVVESVEQKPYKRNFEEQPFNIDDFLLYVEWKEDADGTVDSEGDRLAGLPIEQVTEYYENKYYKLKEKYESLTSDEILDILMYLGLIENNE
jgi:hypothetical protein